MPLYEYECPSCGHRFEKIQNRGDSAIVYCRDCRTVARRLVSMVNHSFGWRLTEASHERFGPRDEHEKDV